MQRDVWSSRPARWLGEAQRWTMFGAALGAYDEEQNVDDDVQVACRVQGAALGSAP